VSNSNAYIFMEREGRGRGDIERKFMYGGVEGWGKAK
jgi:hypothetical protein